MQAGRKLDGGNRILDALRPEERDRIERHLTKQDYALGDVVFRSEEKIDQLVFPIDCMGSVVGVTPTGMSAEIGLIGREGAIGSDVLIGGTESVNQVVIQIAGEVLVLPTAVAREEFARSGTFHDQILQCVYRLMVQVSQTAVCNRLHNLEQRLSRWLLMCHDRSDGDTIKMTQEFVAFMVGTNRTGVTKVASGLQERGLINYSRGAITILDKPALAEVACECYKVIAGTVR